MHIYVKKAHIELLVFVLCFDDSIKLLVCLCLFLSEVSEYFQKYAIIQNLNASDLKHKISSLVKIENTNITNIKAFKFTHQTIIMCICVHFS